MVLLQTQIQIGAGEGQELFCGSVLLDEHDTTLKAFREKVDTPMCLVIPDLDT